MVITPMPVGVQNTMDIGTSSFFRVRSATPSTAPLKNNNKAETNPSLGRRTPMINSTDGAYRKIVATSGTNRQGN